MNMGELNKAAPASAIGISASELKYRIMERGNQCRSNEDYARPLRPDTMLFVNTKNYYRDTSNDRSEKMKLPNTGFQGNKPDKIIDKTNDKHRGDYVEPTQ